VSKLDLYSEPFSKTGNMAAEGFRRLLGRPTLGLLQTLLRESIQNVLDAATGESGPRILIRLRSLTSSQQAALSREVFVALPDEDATRSDIAASLGRREVKVLEICDFGTVGLSGPTRADAPHDGEETLNFVNFLRNVGAGRDTRQGGGTYGYGKSSLYAMSRCSTIIVDSLTSQAGVTVRRLMGCHLGAAFDAHGPGGRRRRFTGRHWWGVRDDEDSIEPLCNQAANELSRRLGLPDREPGGSGTSIMILDPELGSVDQSDVGREIVETVLWNFWPRMTSTTPVDRQISVAVEIEGHATRVPSPEQFPPLDLFASAMAALRRGDDLVEPVLCGRPKKRLGNLAMETGMRGSRFFAGARNESVIPVQCSHIALMRPVELVVTYLQGEPLPDPSYEWAGVFVCADDDEVEGAFADAEPPAHDDWVPDNLPKGPAKTMVNVALRRLREAAQSHASPSAPSRVGEAGPSLASPATQLGRLLQQTSAQGPGRRQRTQSPARPPKAMSISSCEFVKLEPSENGGAAAVFRAELRNDRSDAGLTVVATPSLVADGASISNDDLPSEFVPEVIEMAMAEGEVAAKGGRLEVGTRSGEIIVRVAMPKAMAAVAVRLDLKGARE
jgi:hypothetical protein